MDSDQSVCNIGQPSTNTEDGGDDNCCHEQLEMGKAKN